MRFFSFPVLVISGLALFAGTAEHGFAAQPLSVASPSTKIPLDEAPPPSSIDGTAEGDDLEQLDKRASETLDSLFADLKRQSNQAAANRISKKIWNEWNGSGSDSVDLLMLRVSKAMEQNKSGVALDLLDHIITLAPDYAEGWNRRATLHFAMNDYGKSITDVERVLELEPRHFGALSGLAVMLEKLGKDKKSLETWYKVLEIYPANSQAQSNVIKLEDKLSGNPT